MDATDGTAAVLAGAWHRQSAAASLERWREVCAHENWGDIPANQPLLINVFGASWYFTRYIFYRGREAALLLDTADPRGLTPEVYTREFAQIKDAGPPERQLEQLRLLKNGFMLQILACDLSRRMDQEQCESALTQLARATLAAVLDIFGLHPGSGFRLAVYGMGRMAGGEMTFGSDLDLIFVFAEHSVEETHELFRKVRLFMRHIAAAGSAGSLYEIDMRLRPHGTSGMLITPTHVFIEYHQSEREIWERQMMTRCRAVVDPHGLGAECMDRICPYIYAVYDRVHLRREIDAMRRRVQEEKGNLGGRFEVKRGPGGIMDIDFLTHFLQLSYGHDHPELRTCGTRAVLRAAAGRGLLAENVARELLSHYDFLKRIESSIRLFDMKPISAFPMHTAEHLPVAAALGYAGDHAPAFVEQYKDVTASVRARFREIVGAPP
jgi:glutamate-ammonia-ligase adenylyltransferase